MSDIDGNFCDGNGRLLPQTGEEWQDKLRRERDQPKKQELPPEDAAYLKQAEEFLIQSAKMGNAPLAYMIAAAFKNEAANKKLRSDNEAKDARIAELERANAKIPKMYVWGTGRQGFYATAQAYSVAEARELLLEETGTTDGSCPIRALAIEAVRNENPTIFYRPNAQFTLTDSAELKEMDAYAESLRAKLKSVEGLLTSGEKDHCVMLARIREAIK